MIKGITPFFTVCRMMVVPCKSHRGKVSNRQSNCRRAPWYRLYVWRVLVLKVEPRASFLEDLVGLSTVHFPPKNVVDTQYVLDGVKRHHHMYETDCVSISVNGNTEQLLMERMISSVHVSTTRHIEKLQSKTRHSKHKPEHVAAVFGVGIATAKDILAVTTGPMTSYVDLYQANPGRILDQTEPFPSLLGLKSGQTGPTWTLNPFLPE